MDIKSQAERYAEKFRLIPETKGWYQQKVDDFTAGYKAALRQFAVSGSVADAVGRNCPFCGEPCVECSHKATER